MNNQRSVLVPYGSGSINCHWSLPVDFTIIRANFHKASDSPEKLIERSLDSPLGPQNPLKFLAPESKVAITVNDKTRPVPNHIMLPPLLERLGACGITDANIVIFIASGTHKPMRAEEFGEILPEDILNRFKVISHDSDDHSKLSRLGTTFHGTPVWANSDYYHSDLRIVVGDIEPHHFAGYSGGVKSAAIGLCGRETISANHQLLLENDASIGIYDQNPLRMDIEEIGRMIKVDLALNSVLDEQKQIIDVFFGDPISVMKAGISLVDQMCRIPVPHLFDVVIASPGGYPRDINLYQAQKAMTTAAQFCKPGGKLVLIAECREGIGSPGYTAFMKGVNNVKEIIPKFASQGFALGAHKAFLTARIQEKVETFLASSLPGDLVSAYFFTPVDPADLQISLNKFAFAGSKIAFLPYAPVCMPGGVKELT